MADELDKSAQSASAAGNPYAAAEAAAQNNTAGNVSEQSAASQPPAGIPVATQADTGTQAGVDAWVKAGTQPESQTPPVAQPVAQPAGQAGQYGSYANAGQQAPANSPWHQAPASPAPTYAQPGGGTYAQPAPTYAQSGVVTYAQPGVAPASAGLTGGKKFGWLVVGMLLNIPGMLIAWLTNADKSEQVKRDAILWSVIGFGIGVVLNLILFTMLTGVILAGIGGATEVYASGAYL